MGLAAAMPAGGTVVAASPMVPSGFVAVTDGSGSLQISQFTLDGTLVRRLTTGPANHNFPSLSPDQKHMVFSGDEGGRSEIYSREMRPGAPATQLTSAPLTATSPSWSPDGRSIVYSALVPGAPTYQLFSADADGQHPVQLTHSLDAGKTQPVFSPDGRRIAFISGGATHANQIWVMNADGSDPRPLTEGPRDAYPQWLDSQTVYFAREDLSRNTTEIVSVRLDGGERVESPETVRLIEPRPLPDGRSYGATIEEATGLHLVRIYRSDGANLSAAPTTQFKVDRLRVPATDGSAFTLAWIMSQPGESHTSTAAIYAVVALAAVAAALIAALGVRAFQKN